MVYATRWSSSHRRGAIWHLQVLDARTTCQVLQCKQLHPRVHNQTNNNINNHCSRSSQRESHLTNSLQGIQRCILWENSHKITTLSIIQPCHQTQELICTQIGQSLPTQPHQTSSLQRICWRTPQDRENLPLEISPGYSILLCQKERSWEITSLPRVSVPQ